MSIKTQSRKSVRVILDDESSYVTEINGSKESILEYFLGKSFNFGVEGDLIKKCKQVIFEG